MKIDSIPEKIESIFKIDSIFYLYIMDKHILELMLLHTNTGKDYKNYCLVSKTWYAVISKLFPGGDRFCNHLLTLLMKFPDGLAPDNNWNYFKLSANESITLDYIKANINKFWDFYNLGFRSDITPEFVDEYSSVEYWSYYVLLSNPNFTWDFISKNIYKIGYDNRFYYYNSNITWDIVKNNPNINWDYSRFSISPNITWEIIRDNPEYPWSIRHMIKHNPNITWDNIQTIPNVNNNIKIFCEHNHNAVIDMEKYEHLIDYNLLSRNMSLTEEFIIKHLDKPWNYENLSSSLNLITWNLLELTLDKPWNYRLLAFKIRIKLENFKTIIDKIHYYEYLSNVVTWDYILEFPDKPWDYDALSHNLNIPLNIIFDNLDKPWNFSYISSRNDLTWRDIVNNPKIPWNVRQLSSNRFKK